MYVDDTNPFVAGKQVSIKTRLNVKKTEYTIIESYKRICNIQKESTFKIKISKHEIIRKKSTKRLGVIIDEHFSVERTN